jgi:thiol-disulfide isomerase/thioredoxin
MTPICRRHLLSMAAGACASCADVLCAAAAPLVELPGHVQAPNFDLADLDRVIHRLSDYRGHPVLFSFWAVWCAPCRRELPSLAALRARLRDADIAILAVNLGDSPGRINSFLADHPSPGLPILLGSGSTATSWHVQGLPVAFVVDTEGILRLGALGEVDWGDPGIERELRALARMNSRQSQAVQPILASPGLAPPVH